MNETILSLFMTLLTKSDVSPYLVLNILSQLRAYNVALIGYTSFTASFKAVKENNSYDPIFPIAIIALISLIYEY